MRYYDYDYGYNDNHDRERKKTKAVVLLGIIILFLLATIAGLTYLLFASDGNNGKIGINVTTGECKIDIVDAEDKSLVGGVLDFVNAEESENTYFAPGATYYTESFQVKNMGTIPVNFRIYTSENEDTGTFGEAFELWITTNPENLDAAEKLTEFTGRLEIDEKSEIYYLVIKMKETAGNEFQNKTYTGIGVTVHAVQDTVEIE